MLLLMKNARSSFSHTLLYLYISYYFLKFYFILLEYRRNCLEVRWIKEWWAGPGGSDTNKETPKSQPSTMWNMPIDLSSYDCLDRNPSLRIQVNSIASRKYHSDISDNRLAHQLLSQVLLLQASASNLYPFYPCAKVLLLFGNWVYGTGLSLPQMLLKASVF